MYIYYDIRNMQQHFLIKRYIATELFPFSSRPVFSLFSSFFFFFSSSHFPSLSLPSLIFSGEGGGGGGYARAFRPPLSLFSPLFFSSSSSFFPLPSSFPFPSFLSLFLSIFWRGGGGGGGLGPLDLRLDDDDDEDEDEETEEASEVGKGE